MPITRVSVISLPVSDQERSKAFFVDALGFRLVNDNPMGAEGLRWVEVQPEGGGPSITLTTWLPTMHPGSIKGTVLQTSDVDATKAELEARGVVFAGPVGEEPWGRWTQFDDPDGNGFVLVQPKDDQAG